MAIRIAINGYGRIGRCLLRALYECGYREQLQVVVINEIADVATMAHLTKYDSTHGRFPVAVSHNEEGLLIKDDFISVINIKDSLSIDWSDYKIDLLLECTGQHEKRVDAQQYIAQGAKHVLYSQPAENTVDATIVYGVNESLLTADMTIVSAASCTTNCIVPIIDCLNREIGIEQGVITTIHSAMNDQPVIDAYHHTDLRKTRSASQSIIPVDTELAKGIERILPSLAGRFEAQALRVPTVNVSAIDLSIVVSRDTSVEEINQLLLSCSKGHLSKIMGYTDEPLASCDFNHDARSSIVDASQTRVAGSRLVKVLAWFDNEWAYANRMLDIIIGWPLKH